MDKSMDKDSYQKPFRNTVPVHRMVNPGYTHSLCWQQNKSSSTLHLPCLGPRFPAKATAPATVPRS